MDLQGKIEQGNHADLQEFWGMIETKGAPLIEKIDGDLENSLVTFIYKVDEEIENIVLMPPVDWDNLQEGKMQRLLETNLWYITYKTKNDVRFRYLMDFEPS